MDLFGHMVPLVLLIRLTQAIGQTNTFKYLSKVKKTFCNLYFCNLVIAKAALG